MGKLFEKGHALIIGTDYKPNKKIRAQVERDVENIKSVILDENLAGYNRENVTFLLHDDAKKEAILSALDKLIDNTSEDSTVLIYYTGHGGRDKNTGRSYLCPSDHLDNDPDSFSISAEELQGKLKAIKSNVKILLLDCCHAQGIAPKGSEPSGSTNAEETVVDKNFGDLDELGKKFFDFENLIYVSSCKAKEQSWAMSNQSFFTQCLVEALKGEHKQSFDDPFIRGMELVQYLLKQVPARVAEHGQDQHPTFKMNGDHDFILSLAPQSKREEVKSRSSKLSDKEQQLLARIQEEFEVEGKSIQDLKNHSKDAVGDDLLRLEKKLLERYLKRETLAKARTMVNNMENVNVAEVLGDHAKIFQNITGNVEVVEGDKTIVHGNDHSQDFKGSTFNGPVSFGNTVNENIQTKNEAEKIVNQKADKIVNIEKIDDATFNL